MKKDTIEFQRTKDFPCNYGRMNYPTAESTEVLDKIIEWSRQEGNLNKKIYRHKLRTEQENVDNNNVYKYFTYGSAITKEDYEARKAEGRDAYFVAYCELVDYLDIYYQD